MRVKYVCANCGSDQIEHKAWVDVNNDTVLNEASFSIIDNWRRTCNAHVKFKVKTTSKRKKKNEIISLLDKINKEKI